MLIKEYRITMPLTLDEYQIGHRYTEALAPALNRTNNGGDETVEVITNEPFTDFPLFDGKYNSGHYTFKKYGVKSRIPAFIRWMFPKDSMEFQEECWNAFPYSRTVISNQLMLGDRFRVVIESLYLADRGEKENAHNLLLNKLNERSVVHINITTRHPTNYDAAIDPTQFYSPKADRGLLRANFGETCDPVMTCYKVVYVEFKALGFQTRIEKFIHKEMANVFHLFHQGMFCLIEKWLHMTLPDILALEDRTFKDDGDSNSSSSASEDDEIANGESGDPDYKKTTYVRVLGDHAVPKTKHC